MQAFVAEQDTPLADRCNMVYLGTGGNGRAVVVATGSYTELGAVQSLVGEARPPATPMQRQLDAMGMQLALLSGGVCALVLAIGVLRGLGWLEMLKSSISLAVAAVPEGLPTVATTTLALGIRQMQRHRVLVRQLPAIEGLGSVQVICLDKTGTLTENQIKVVNIVTATRDIALNNGSFAHQGRPLKPRRVRELERLLEVVCLCSESKLSVDAGPSRLEGSPTENALVEVAGLAGIDLSEVRGRYPLVKRVDRAETRPYMITLHRDGDGRLLVAVKGSPAEVLAMCTFVQQRGKVTLLDEAGRAGILERNQAMAGNALRVLGVAYKQASGSENPPGGELIWLGLVGMEDAIPPGYGKSHDAVS